MRRSRRSRTGPIWRPGAFGVTLPQRAVRRRSRARAGAAAGFAVGLALMAGGGVALAEPLWSSWLTAGMQRTAAQAFARAAAVPPGSVTASGVTGGVPLPGTPVFGLPAVAADAPPADAVSAPSVEASSLSPGTSSAPSADASAALAAARLAAPAAPAEPGQVMARLVIPSIGVDSYVVEGLTFSPPVWEALLRRGPAHLAGSALPGQVGESVIFGHLNVWGAPFLHLDRLRPGAVVEAEVPGGVFTYRVTSAQVVSPSDTAVLAPQSGVAGVALVTCTGLFDTQRLVVRAVMVTPQRPMTASRVPAAGDLAGAVATVLRYEAAPAPPSEPVGQTLGPDAADISAGWAPGPAMPGWGLPGRRPAPLESAFVTDAWSPSPGEAEVEVREQYAVGSRAVAFVALGAGNDWALVGERVAQGAPPVRLSVPQPSSDQGWARGDAVCGDYHLHWDTGTVGEGVSGGFRFPQRTTQIRVTGPDGAPLPGIAVPGLTMGTYPVACGDLLADGGTALVLRTDLPTGGVSQVTVYQLERSGARLVGQMATVGSPAYPRVVQPVPDAPADLVVRPVGASTDQWWGFAGGRYRVEVRGSGP